MMIKKKANDTTRKNVARSSAIMMTHPLCAQEKPGIQLTRFRVHLFSYILLRIDQFFFDRPRSENREQMKTAPTASLSISNCPP